MSGHNVRVRKKSKYGLIKNVQISKVDDRSEKLHMFTKVVLDKQVLRETYIKLMDDAERAVGRKEAIYLFRDAEIIYQKIKS